MPARSLAELESMVGESVRTTEGFLVEAGKVEEFARSVAEEDPLFREESVAEARGYDAVPAPLTFVRTVLFPRYRPEGVDDYRGFDLGFDPEYTLHGEHGFEFDRPLLVGDELSGLTTLIDVYEREGRRGGTMTFAEWETEYTDADGERVLVEHGTMIETAGAVAEGDDA